MNNMREDKENKKDNEDEEIKKIDIGYIIYDILFRIVSLLCFLIGMGLFMSSIVFKIKNL